MQYQHRLFDEQHFPDWLPDETVHSYIGRYQALSGVRRRWQVAFRLFGRGSYTAKHDFPIALTTFSRNILQIGGDPVTLIQDRTIAPFFLPFFTSNVQDRVIGEMLGETSSSVAAVLGLIRSHAVVGHPLKGCRLCMSEDLPSVGAAYWRREHQNPGVWICARHGQLLAVAIDEQRTPSRWYLPSECGFEDLDVKGDGSTLALLAAFASWSTKLIGLRIGFAFDLNRVRDVIHSELAKLGYRTRRGNVRVPDLARSFSKYWLRLAEFKFLPILDGNLKRTTRFLGDIVQYGSSSPHPLCWLALLIMLFGHWEAFFASYELCRSGHHHISSDRARDNIRRAAEERSKRSALILMSTGSSVRAAARATGASASLVRRWCLDEGIGVDRVLKSVSIEDQIAVRQGFSRGQTLESIAQDTGINAALIGSVVSATPDARATRRDEEHEARRSVHRAAFLRAIEAKSDVRRSKIRLRCLTAYSWLLKNDRSWLEANLPDAAQRYSGDRGALPPEENRPQLPLVFD